MSNEGRLTPEANMSVGLKVDLLDQKDHSSLFCKNSRRQSTFNPFSVVVASAFN
jgi:hypothetical protein